MRNLFVIMALGIVMGFSSLSFATDSYNVFGVQLPIVKSEVKNEIKGGNVEKEHMSFYYAYSIKEANTATSLSAGPIPDDDRDYIQAFGVLILLRPET